MIKLAVRSCELCTAEAALYCPSDSAFLCWNCDAVVHGANFLVARHLRRTICSRCGGFTGFPISGNGRCQSPPEPVCCSDTLSSSSIPWSSSVLASTESLSSFRDAARTEIRETPPWKRECWMEDRKAERVLGNWCAKLGLGVSTGGAVARAAGRALGICLGRTRGSAGRVGLAGAVWVGLRLWGRGRWGSREELKRVEMISGVPSELIVAAAQLELRRVLKVMRIRKTRGRRQLQEEDEEEGWGEC